MSDADWVSLDQALAMVLASVEPVSTESVSLSDALGRALAAPLDSPVDHPPWDNSAMDGFAVHAEDVAGATAERPVTLPISDDIPAGRFPRGSLRRGTAARVMTGAPVPDGATGVIRVEHAADAGDSVEVRDGADARRHIRRRGEDIRAGDRLLDAGVEIGPAETAILAMAGAASVSTGRRPRVGILANGDELADFDDYDDVIAGRRIMNSNGHAVAAQVRTAGAIPVPLGIARDDPADLAERIRRGADCDAIVSAAGVSVGEHDHVKRVLDGLGFERRFWRVTVRPGSATLFGLLGGRPFWGVPGNPVSAMVTFEILVRPALRRMAGFARFLPASILCRLSGDARGPADVVSLLRVRLVDVSTDPPTVSLTGPQGSGILSSMLADGLLELPMGVEVIGDGEHGRVLPLRRWSLPG